MIIDEDLVRSLVASQFPEYTHLPVAQVLPGGNDNRTFRLGDELSARLPSAEGYVAGVAKEQRWLPYLAPHLPLPIPNPVGQGRPELGFPWPWTINRWMPGADALTARGLDKARFATDVGRFLAALQRVDATEGPLAGEHSFFRGASLMHYDEETRSCLGLLADDLGAEVISAAERVWDDATATEWDRAPVWFHGDIAPGNLLVEEGELCAVIDFGTSGVGDPACDLVLAWTFLDAAERALFSAEVELDDATWARARGWALWKALLMAVAQGREEPENYRVIREVLGSKGG